MQLTIQQVHKISIVIKNYRSFEKETTSSKLKASINSKRYTVLKEWNFNWKERYSGDKAVLKGPIFYGFKNKKITFDEVTKNSTNANKNLVWPSKNYRVLIVWEWKGGQKQVVAKDIDIGFKMTGTVYWRDAAPF